MKWQVGGATAERWRRRWERAAPFVNAAVVIAFSVAVHVVISWGSLWAILVGAVWLVWQVHAGRQEMRRADETGELVRSDVRGTFSVRRVSSIGGVRADLRGATRTADARRALAGSDLGGAFRVRLPWPGGQERRDGRGHGPSRPISEQGGGERG